MPALTGIRAAVTAVRSKDVGSSQKAKEASLEGGAFF